uniref:Rho-type guanine nucleotide exchange factor, isoform G n=1 Tax=Drosophila melanogaster TaxID=7227 RepID=M9PGB1_DROME|nr:Rho-type guanine nucleotide exchange factor, isoform G [Drosophila melanogaster]AGB93157.1 Rho-type guanine nucleotide exchange factor, isoform G [Drosophila melanogaster]|eukprot:NP_001260622.1 Rho-type guanine nucleotide exchange factor, isoform G [Drosophila melanogaster]
MDQPLVVQAEYSFMGSNNDELCFQKGDVITVTQREDGGWWEGTLNDKTGWFPSNYVNECKVQLPLTETIRPPEEIQEYRSVVLKDLLDSERAHVAELQGLLENFLEPMQQTQILSQDEYAQLMCNFVEIVRTHEDLLIQIEECNDRVGKLFLTSAPLMKKVHQAYCAAHPKAIVILDKYKDELEKYMERQGAATPGLLVLTTGLSKPFRRLDKYSAMLQELERHMESSHPDRGDTQRSVAVYKDIAATCSATRRQKELELQVLTGPVRGWQGQELSTLGDIIHMGSVAVGADHRDRYFVLFPQTLLFLSVSQRMSAFIYEGKLPLTGIIVNRLEDTDALKNAFEISSPLIDRIVAVCQGPNEANKWVELLNANNPSLPMGIKRQLSNLSNSSLGHLNAAHMSPPSSHILLPPGGRPPATPSSIPAGSSSGGSHSHQGSPATNSMSHHKRSQSFNHHLSYNQYTPTQPPPHHLHPPQPPSLPSHLGASGPRSSSAQTPNSKTAAPLQASSMDASPAIQAAAAAAAAAVGMGVPSARKGSTKANWTISCLRPTPPLRPSLLNATSGSGSGSGGSGGGGSSSSNALASYCSGRKNQPTYEEDALVLRVFEAYCAAYQNNARNTIHSALQPWTPCLPIRGGKLKTSKTFSTSNPQLPFIANVGNSAYLNQHQQQHLQQQHLQQQHLQQQHLAQQQPGRQHSAGSLNSSFIWREASPNNFNLYSSSVSSSLNATPAQRYSLSGTAGGSTSIKDYQRALSEERATRKSLNRLKSGFGSGYDNVCTSPLLPRKNKPAPKLVAQQSYQRSPGNATATTIVKPNPPGHPGLYDRRLNRSFETSTSHRYAGYGAGYLMNCGGALRTSTLQRSTPQLAGGERSDDSDVERELLRGNGAGPTASLELNPDGSKRQSGSWCCGNFVMKQWRKINHV